MFTSALDTGGVSFHFQEVLLLFNVLFLRIVNLVGEASELRKFKGATLKMTITEAATFINQPSILHCD